MLNILISNLQYLLTTSGLKTRPPVSRKGGHPGMVMFPHTRIRAESAIRSMKSPAILAASLCLVLSAADIGWQQDNKHFKPATAHEGAIAAFLKPAAIETQQLFPGGRFPNIAVAMDGTVLAAYGGVDLRRSEDGGKTWSPAARIAKGFSISGLTVDQISGDILAFMEDGHPPSPLHLHRSKDADKTWEKQDFTLHPNSLGHTPALHMNENGITLRHGQLDLPHDWAIEGPFRMEIENETGKLPWEGIGW